MLVSGIGYFYNATIAVPTGGQQGDKHGLHVFSVCHIRPRSTDPFANSSGAFDEALRAGSCT